MTEDQPRQYTTGDVNRIIRRALKIDTAESISHNELLETAQELGIDASKIEEAVKLEAAAMEKEKLRNAYITRNRSLFNKRLWIFGVLNAGLFLINLLTPGHWWFQWVLLGTGISLAVRFRKTYFPTDDQIDNALLRHERLKKRFHRLKH